MSSPLVAPPVVKVQALNCPHCGAAVQLRGFGTTLNVVCPNCLTLLDATTPAVSILQTFQARERIQPKIPLGSRGSLGNTVFEVVGFQVRTALGEDAYQWDEYVLFNPYYGFRYLSEYRGHWNLIRTLNRLPQPDPTFAKLSVFLDGGRFRLFSETDAVTSYVLGEFPWQVRLGEKVHVVDYIAPPYALSSETTGAETVWSRGEYVPGKQVWQIFRLPGEPPEPVGIFENQPSPWKGRVRSAWRTYLVLLFVLLLTSSLVAAHASREIVFEHTYSAAPRAGLAELSFVTPVFELRGHPSSVEIETHTDLVNSWMYLNFALIDQDSGRAWDFGREVSYYSGRDSDGTWTEGGPHDAVKVPSVPAGRYYLRVEPELNPGSSPVNYSIRVIRDVPTWGWFWIAFFLLPLPAIVIAARAASFERARYAESDYAQVLRGGAARAGDD